MLKRQSRLIIAVLLLVFSIAVRHILTGGASVIKLQKAPPLSGIVAQGLGPSEKNRSLPVPGKDFLLDEVTYFDNKDWLVATVKPIQKNTDVAYVVMHKTQGSYQIVLGPGTAFSGDFLESLPNDVGQYLNRKGTVYAP